MNAGTAFEILSNIRSKHCLANNDLALINDWLAELNKAAKVWPDAPVSEDVTTAVIHFQNVIKRRPQEM